MFIVLRIYDLWFLSVRIAPEKGSKRLVPPQPKSPLSYLALELQGWQGSRSSRDSINQMVDYKKNPHGQCGDYSQGHSNQIPIV